MQVTKCSLNQKYIREYGKLQNKAKFYHFHYTSFFATRVPHYPNMCEDYIDNWNATECNAIK